MKTKRTTILLILLWALAPALAAVELSGKVVGVSGGSTVTLKTDAGRPATGDPVILGFEVPGVGFVALEGRWQVSLIGPGGEIQARPQGAGHGTPQIGYLARIESSQVASIPSGGKRAASAITPSQPVLQPRQPVPSAPSPPAPSATGLETVPQPLPPPPVGPATYVAGTESGNRSGLLTLVGGVRAQLAARGVYLRELPPEVGGMMGIGQTHDWLLAQVSNLGGTHLLYLDLRLKWTNLGMGKDRLRVTCLDMNRRTLWSEEVTNLMAQNAAGSLQRVAHKTGKKLQERVGGPCLTR